ncbi:hypothetical protein GCM10010441_20890 [Kitasatospora paracochleata]
MAEPEQREVGAVAGGAHPVLGDAGQVDLVLQDHLGPRPGPQRLQQVGVPARQLAGVVELPARGVDQSGGADGDGVQVSGAGPLGGGQQGLDGPGGEVVRVPGAGRYLGGGEGASGQVGDDQRDAGGADVDPGQVGAVGDQRVHPCVGAAADVRALPGDGDQPAALEPVQQVGDGGTGESGQGAQLGRGQRPLLKEQVEGQPVVDGAGGARRGRTRGRHGRILPEVSIRIPS